MEQDRRCTPPELAKVILARYLRQPQLVDTADGLARWRVLEEMVHHTVADTRDAITWLLAQGFLLEESRVGSPPILSFDRSRTRDAERLLDVDDGKARGA